MASNEVKDLFLVRHTVQCNIKRIIKKVISLLFIEFGK
jgi:hypothetical protein